MTSDFNLAWRQTTRDGLTWRLAVMDDLPRLRELWAEMDEKLGEKQDKPDLFAMPVLLTLVAEDTSGKLIAAIYGEAVVDWAMIGTDRAAARSIDELWPQLTFFLFERTVRVTRVLVPMRLRRHMARLLPQMRDITQLFAQFSCTIRL